MNPESHRLYHRERGADAARTLHGRGTDVSPRATPVRAHLLRVLASLRRVPAEAPQAPPARAPR
jgi:hypothetical protein